ncbi:Asp-tRNA(Asn)/Glu-tRNA(Gln) amidotransferase subunit GatA [Thermomicrobium sp. 4228-Ro]|uniref:Asp-tRNA(Asn)/Glu-tRNA(Gln) amidotransferase subunit GatA n=1 Tax=Thermomicrobium sp. 4228-Ro TaxID=2993937 RepID=UPI002248949C|nr:Asp-tRNA(Asn)/Glu-tRNA(Gln) amidotransferase subunit GatA [Thermomicrobium sp. 4228-Ro]MCX2726931.1 Asp-tRNA(Asn)/Glu-tRNA(Gln) amidotransferase subunit GatA [Thermomicrobium sp. 4228-Ro]
MTSELIRLTVAQARVLLDQREVSAVELLEAHLAQIERLEPQLHAFITLTPDIARRQAEEADRRIARGEAAPLTGIPIGLKDNLCTVDAPTTAGSRILQGFLSPYDATVVARLREQGAVFLGKTNTDEFAMGSSTENSAYGPTRNPWDRERVPGGSSGGSAAAVAAGEAMLALGSDTGGSIRQPAGFCGIVGLKPTYGRVSRYGLIAFASSLDQIGPFGRTVEDVAVLLQVIAGYDPADSTSVPVPVPDYRAALTGDIRGLRIGIPAEYRVAGMDPAVEQVIDQALATLQELGAELVPVSLPHTEYALATYYIIAPSEASANLARYDGIKYGLSLPGETLLERYLRTRGEGFGPEVKRRIMLGTYALSAGYYDAYYVKAQKVRTLIKRDFDQAFERVDVIAAPTSPTVAFRLGERTADPLQMYLSDVFTIPANMAGLPAIAVPCGFAHGLPVSLQFMGRPFDEPTLLRVADAYERATPWHTEWPKLAVEA